MMSHKQPYTNWQIATAAVLLLIILAGMAHLVRNDWRYANGYEQEWVAGSMLGGYGYSFDPGSAWLGPYGQGKDYTPTAWVEPLYTLLIFASFKIFGDYGRLLLVLLNVLWLGATSVMVFLIIREILNKNIALYTVLLFLLIQPQRSEVILYIGNAALAGFLYCLIAYLLIRSLKDPSIKNCILLGVTVGVANLNHAGSLLFAPLVALVLFFGIGFRKPAAWRSSLIVLGLTLLLLTPWIVRNYLVFNAFVPVRSGFGYQLYIGNPGLARTFTAAIKPEVEDTDPAWSANSPMQALRYLRDLKYDGDLASHSMDYILASSPSVYRSYNEVQRDRVFLSRSLAFLREEPLLAIKMGIWKAITFLTFWQWSLALISLAALVGGLLMIRDMRVLAILLLVLGYAAPYAASLPLYYRYRSPVEPLLFVLGGMCVGFCLQKLFAKRALIRNPAAS